MSLILIEGFDHLNTADDLRAKGWDISNMYVAPNVAGRFDGGKALQVTHRFAWAISPAVGSLNTIYFGFAMKNISVGNPQYYGNQPWLEFMDGSQVVQLKLYVIDDGSIAVYKGDDTYIGGSAKTGMFAKDQWHYFEVKVVIHATAGEVTLKYDEVEIFSDTACDTKNGTDYINFIRFLYVYNAWTVYFDDIYIDDSQFHGNCKIRTFMPDSDETHSDFVRSTGSNDFECVDEIPANDDTDYIYSTTVGHKSTFGITTGALGTVKAVQVTHKLRVTNVGPRRTKLLVRSNSTDYQSAESDPLSSGWQPQTELWETDPDDSNVWTQAKLEAAEFGLEITV